MRVRDLRLRALYRGRGWRSVSGLDVWPVRRLLYVVGRLCCYCHYGYFFEDGTPYGYPVGDFGRPVRLPLPVFARWAVETFVECERRERRDPAFSTGLE